MTFLDQVPNFKIYNQENCTDHLYWIMELIMESLKKIFQMYKYGTSAIWITNISIICTRLLTVLAFRTHELPKFHYWFWGTMAGVTGVLLTIVTGSIFICSLPMVRKSFYNWFSFVHSLYPVFYILMILHGSGRLVQESYFHYFFLGPAILFIFDKVITLTRKTIDTIAQSRNLTIRCNMDNIS
nr:PREDICTED: dual oxidase 2-like isoform X2 [Linepithema humile]